MDRHTRIDVFSLAAHRLALARLREQPGRLNEALDVLDRWRARAGASHSDVYWDEWERMLRAGVDAVETHACASSDHGATLRSVSPLGRFISPAERKSLLRQALEAP